MRLGAIFQYRDIMLLGFLSFGSISAILPYKCTGTITRVLREIAILKRIGSIFRD